MNRRKRITLAALAIPLLALGACVHGGNYSKGETRVVSLDIKGKVAKPDAIKAHPGDTIVFKDQSGRDFYLFMKERGFTPFDRDNLCSEKGVLKARVTANPKKETRYPYGLFMPGMGEFDPFIIVQPR